MYIEWECSECGSIQTSSEEDVDVQMYGFECEDCGEEFDFDEIIIINKFDEEDIVGYSGGEGL